MRTAVLLGFATLLAGMSAPALAQSSPTPHQHGQSAAVVPGSQPGQHPGMQKADGRCDCCAMMQQMMQMMQTMHQHSGQQGMMPSPAPRAKGPSSSSETEHQHTDKPRK